MIRRVSTGPRMRGCDWCGCSGYPPGASACGGYVRTRAKRPMGIRDLKVYEISQPAFDKAAGPGLVPGGRRAMDGVEDVLRRLVPETDGCATRGGARTGIGVAISQASGRTASRVRWRRPDHDVRGRRGPRGRFDVRRCSPMPPGWIPRRSSGSVYRRISSGGCTGGDICARRFSNPSRNA